MSKEPDPGAIPDEEETGGPPAPKTSPAEHTLDDVFGKSGAATGPDGGLEFETDAAPATPSPSAPPDSSYDAGHDFGWHSSPPPVDDVYQIIGEAIENTNFVVTAGQPSHGRAPTSPTDGVFALEFPGTGGQLGGGPAGPFTCTLTSVDVPAGYQLAPHTDKEWSLKA